MINELSLVVALYGGMSFISMIIIWISSLRTATKVSWDLVSELPTDNSFEGSHKLSGLSILRIVKFPLIIFIIASLLALLFIYELKLPVAILILSYSGWFLAKRYYQSSKEQKIQAKFDYYLPLLMERLIMTIEAGQDVISGIKLIVRSDSDCQSSTNPLSQLFLRVIELTEQGLTFTESLKVVGDSTKVSAVKHAFVHIALAYEQGGELILPLRELSDATQLQYQEVIEEKIAKLPVRATLPLLLLFAGLIILFITPPVLAVLSLTSGGKI